VVKRRSMNDAMTPEEEAFLNPEIASIPEPKGKHPRAKSPPAKVKRKPVISTNTEKPPENPKQDFGGKFKLSVDINTEMSTALLRASLQRKLAKQTPHTQREIVSEAVATWLKSHGFLK
jgi:hypothetical protein